MNIKIGFVTSADLPLLTDSEREFAEYAKTKGLTISPLVWSAKEQDLSVFDFLVIRTCWDYYLRLDEFSAWLDFIESKRVKVWNPLNIMRRNLHKFYLRELEQNGVPIIPTVFLKKNSAGNLNEIMNTNNWNKTVIKPAVSATAYKTYLVSRHEAQYGQEILDGLLSNNDIMIQKFADEIKTEGEWSLMFFGGKYSHAVLKVPAENDFRVQADFGGKYADKEPPGHLIKSAEFVLSKIPEKLLYARVDGVNTKDGFRLMELELIEPDLFLKTDKAKSNFLHAILELAVF